MSMTTEQREAIDYLKESVLIYKNTIPKISDAINTVLSLIKEQQEEIEKYKSINKNQDKDIKKAVDYTFELNKEIEHKEKIIELMIDEFYKKAKISTKCYLQKSIEECMKYKNCKECLKQYFANKVNSKIQ